MAGSGRKKGIKYPLVVLLGISLLCASTHAFSQTQQPQTKEEKAEHRAEKRKEIKHFFKKLNPFKKDKDDASASTQQTQTQVVPPPAPNPVTPDNTKSTTTSTKKRAKKTTKPKVEKGVQPLI